MKRHASQRNPSQMNEFLFRLRNTAIEAAETAGAVLYRHFGKKLKISEKKDAGLVTNADLESEERAVKILHRVFPDFGFLTEESEPRPSKNEGRWIIDPLDGTTNYIHGYPMFCISIAAEWKNEITVGVIHHPVFRETYVAMKGQGSTLNGKPIHVSRTKRLKDSLLTTGFTYRKERFLKAEMRTFERLSGIARAIRRPGSAALDLAYTSRGVFDGFWERNLSPWDVAAGALIVMEAGGKVTDFNGNKFRVDSYELMASNYHLHPSLLKQVNAKI